MHINLFMSRPIRRIQQSVDDARKFIGDYIYYRNRSLGHRMAWSMAKRTL